jgi:L-lysine exporter family protein LysE/ArgO
VYIILCYLLGVRSLGNLFSYVFLGVSLAAPIGPVNAGQIDKGIKGGFRHAWLFGLGATTADLIYILLVYLGFVNFLQIPIVKTFLWLFGFFVLVYTGIEGLAAAKNHKLVYGREKRLKLSKSYFSGFFMSLLNPLSILFWIGIYGSILANTDVSDGSKVFFYSSAILSGVLLWDFTMAIFASVLRKYLTNTLLTLISVVSGVSLILFGLYFGYQGLKLIL